MVDVVSVPDQLDQHYLHPSLSTSNAITPLPPPPVSGTHQHCLLTVPSDNESK